MERLHPARVQACAPDVQLVLTRLSGNPDLFVSLTAPAPSTASACLAAASCWQSTDADGDVVLIPHTDPKLIACTQAQQGQNALPCTLHMAVKGVEASSRFSLLASSFKVGAGLHIESPDALAGDYDFESSTFGSPLPLRPLTANVVYAEPGAACPPTADAPGWQLSNAAQLRGAIALIDRGAGPGNCPYPGRYFARKVRAAQEAGAVAAIVCNDHEEAAGHSQLVAMYAAHGSNPQVGQQTPRQYAAPGSTPQASRQGPRRV